MPGLFDISNTNNPFNAPTTGAGSFMGSSAYQTQNWPSVYGREMGAQGVNPFSGGPYSNFVQNQSRNSEALYRAMLAGGYLHDPNDPNAGAYSQLGTLTPGGFAGQYIGSGGQQGRPYGISGINAIQNLLNLGPSYASGAMAVNPGQTGAYQDLIQDPTGLVRAYSGAGGPTPYQSAFENYLSNQLGVRGPSSTGSYLDTLGQLLGLT